MIQTLIQAFQTGGLALTAEEIADVIWLAAQIDLPPAEHSPAEVKPDEPGTEVDRLPTMPDKQQPALDGRIEPGTDAVRRPAETEVHLSKPTPSRSGEVAGVRAVSFHVPAATALPGKLALARRLRPLLRRVPAFTDWVLDEASTAQRAAQERTITPVLQPGRARWLDLAVVVDDWQTMAIWQQTVDEWIELLQQIGAFRTVQTYRLTTALVQQPTGDESAQLHLYAIRGSRGKRGRASNRRELIDPNGRRLILVLTDCTSPAWYNGEAGRLLSLWGQSNMVTLVQMLPADLWDSCALAHAIQVSLSASAPGLPNRKLEVDFPWYWTELEEKKPAGPPVPVITLEPEAIDAWAKVLTGKGGVKAPGFYLPLQPVTSEDEERTLTPEPAPEERWQHFRAWASPMARELAGYLSAAPLSLPVMRLVQRVMLPQSRQVHLAEVLSSELINCVTPYDVMIGPDEIRYEFVEGIRELLLTTVLVSDTRKILEDVSKYVSQRNYQLRNFHALILDPTSSGEFIINSDTWPFARVAIPLLRRLGGDYTTLANRLESESQRLVREPHKKITNSTNINNWFNCFQQLKSISLMSSLLKNEMAPYKHSPTIIDSADFNDYRQTLEDYITGTWQGSEDPVSILERYSQMLQYSIRSEWSGLLLRNKNYAYDATRWIVQMESVQSFVPSDTLLIDYFITNNRIIAFLVTKESIHIYILPGTVVQIRRLLSFLQLNLKTVVDATPDQISRLEDNAKRLLGRLYDLLVAPFAGKLADYQKLIIVPYEDLHDIPFQALYNGNVFLFEQQEISYLPLSSFLPYCQEISQTVDFTESIFVVSHVSELSGIVEEAKTVAELINGSLYLGEAATMDNWKQLAQTCRVLHLVTYHDLQKDKPVSAVLARADGWQNISEILSLNMHASLVTLNILNASTNSSKLLGLPSAFLLAGTASLILNLWSIPDGPTFHFMKMFYQGLVNGLTKGAALRQAQLRFVHSSDTLGEATQIYSHPLYWASFSLIGDSGKL